MDAIDSKCCQKSSLSRDSSATKAAFVASVTEAIFVLPENERRRKTKKVEDAFPSAKLKRKGGEEKREKEDQVMPRVHPSGLNLIHFDLKHNPQLR